jgi:hypothetical protein
MSGTDCAALRHLAPVLGCTILGLWFVAALGMGRAHGQDVTPRTCMSAAGSVAPPQGFSALAASAAQLRCDGFPPRPTKGGEALDRWTELMSRARVYVPPVLKVVPGVIFPTLQSYRRRRAEISVVVRTSAPRVCSASVGAVSRVAPPCVDALCP